MRKPKSCLVSFFLVSKLLTIIRYQFSTTIMGPETSGKANRINNDWPLLESRGEVYPKIKSGGSRYN
jgi:hypothetical protein